MRDDVAAVVNPIVRTALDLRDAWAGGDGPPFDVGRERLREKFADLHRFHPPVRGDAASAPAVDLLAAPQSPADARFLGLGYPLACWVDELFTLRSPVAARWTDRKFEVEYHATNDRAWRFWRQADLAAAQPTPDPLEVFFLCAALGFRGEKHDDPAAYAAWAATARDRLHGGTPADWVGPSAVDPPTSVPPRFGKAGLKRMGLTAGLFALAAVPVAAWLVVRQLVR